MANLRCYFRCLASFAVPFILGSTTLATPSKRSVPSGPATRANFPDPSLIWVPAENSWFAFATNGGGHLVQVRYSLYCHF